MITSEEKFDEENVFYRSDMSAAIVSSQIRRASDVDTFFPPTISVSVFSIVFHTCTIGKKGSSIFHRVSNMHTIGKKGSSDACYRAYNARDCSARLSIY
jgi:hypothetical protein